MEIEAKLQVRVVITDRANLYPRLLELEIELLNPTDDDVPKDNELMESLDRIRETHKAENKLSSSLYDAVIDGAFVDYVKPTECTYDEIYEYYLGLMFTTMEDKKLCYDRLTDVRLTTIGSTSYICLLFDVDSFEGINYVCK